MPRWWMLAVAAGAGLVAGLLLARGKPVDPVLIVRVDSVLAESPAVARQLDSLQRVASQSQRQALKLHGEAERLRRVADSLRDVSSKRWQLLDTMPSQPVVVAYDTLQSAYTALDSAYQQAMAANAALVTANATGSTRIVLLERTLAEAQIALKKTRTPSRFGLGCGAGYAVAMAGGVAHAGPGLACGVTLRLR